MYGKKVKLRVLFISLLLISVILSIFLILKSLEENVVYFLSPSEVKNLTEIENKKIRIGGMVKKNSIEILSDEVNFIITDFKNEITVSFTGAIPNLFAEGVLRDRNYLISKKILAKHDENYMPPEVKEALGEK